MKKTALHRIIRWLAPYGVVSAYIEKNFQQRHNFIELFKQYIDGNERCALLEDNPYESIISIQGFGYSGSGAVVDLLREYDTTHVIGFVDVEGSVSSSDLKFDEVDILRLAGGLFEIERYLDSNNIFQNDALLHRVVAMFDSSDLYRNNASIRQYCYEFMCQICDVLTDSPDSQCYNRYLNHRGVNDILYLKEITLAEYRSLCRKLLNSIFTVIYHSHEKKPILVLDQITNDWEFDMERYQSYIPNLKIIMVYRDPRDVYAFAKNKNVGWIPHKTVEVFLKWYHLLLKHFDVNERKTYLVVQFEQLINNYNTVVTDIEQFVDLQPNEHTKKGTCLDVTNSKKNICLWKQDADYAKDYLTINQHLSPLCYIE